MMELNYKALRNLAKEKATKEAILSYPLGYEKNDMKGRLESIYFLQYITPPLYKEINNMQNYSNVGINESHPKRTACETPGPELTKHSDFLLNRLDNLLSGLHDVRLRLRESTLSITYPREQPTSISPCKKDTGKGDTFVNKLEARLDGLEGAIEDLNSIAYALEGF